ncbi:proton-conducting transporter transmembrane domain-containing protein [Mycolicibacterium pyrenivorans]|uniref:proton-conducting transporter transmembrane domain-containing protein n=1 Tax=Mycolicibacterium pyrenivorans TaxID=187102 RepID=UPI0021F3979B|nr:proton-conducting transporter membrane subunit [Mycolicibacterium pyrenivorans]MCV7154500.1 NADH-quinone oxidoreductase subunit L [Mycolicibacterium pyrenivorans]
MLTVPDLSLWALVCLPALAGVALLLCRAGVRTAAVVSIGVSAVVVALSVVVAVTRPAVGVAFLAGTDFALAVDGLSGTMVPAVAVITLLVLMFAVGERSVAGHRFHGYMLVFAAAAMLTATATTLPALLLAWEVMGAASYALIGYRWQDDHRVLAGLTAFLTTRTADLGLYLAAGAALAGGAGLALGDLAESPPGWRHVIAAGVLVAALGKAAQLPFSFWLARAMEGPSPVSALLHSAAMVAMGAYLLLRVSPLLGATGWAATATVWLGAVTAVALGLVAVAQRDLKQLLAASTSAQLGFVVMAAGLGAVGGGAAQLVAHAFTKAGLFLAAGAWLTLLGSKNLDDLRGAARRWRVVGVAATVSALALAGVAPLSLWATKDAVLAVALEHSAWWYAAGLLATALSAGYAGKILLVLWRPAADRQAAGAAPGALEQIPLVVLAIGAAGAGVLALPPWGITASAPVTELAASAVLAGVVVLAVWRWGVPEPRWALAWFGLERAAQKVIAAPVLRLADSLARFDDRVLDRSVSTAALAVMRVSVQAARFDDHVLDGAVEATATMSRSVADRLDRADHRGVDGVVEASAALTRRLGELARRPQTGQLHQYYMAAAVMIVVAVVLLLT